jgi:hypothetical protein
LARFNLAYAFSDEWTATDEEAQASPLVHSKPI